MDRTREHLPRDLIFYQILPKLPIKSLLRFTSACRTWLSTIKSPHFIAAHHHNLNLSENKVEYILIFDKHSCTILSNDASTKLAKIDFPFTLNFNRPPQSCNGLVLLSHRRTITDFNHDHTLWNPSLRKSKTLDAKIFAQRDVNVGTLWSSLFHHVFYGLGYHEPTKDHRVVRVRYTLNPSPPRDISDFPTEVDVYSVSTDSWHGVDSKPSLYIGLYYHISVFVRGSLHWFGRQKVNEDGDYYKSLLLFDFGQECFREMEMPEHFHHLRYPKVAVLTEFEGTLAAFTAKAGVEWDENGTYLWVMTEYGVAESWTRKLAFRVEVPWPWPTGCTQSAECEDHEKMHKILFGIGSGQSVKVFEGNRSYGNAVVVCKESFALLEA
ncbi:hypothetical protein CDL12_17353 [Handroanthus impetiginosus]|uniref:F-box associated beta-propeller type 1 domain-containing protein n=1 Tax=Handroanthus impetiginosus TaxID=429701 RepID=A0A2G9GXS7_9LAMI|nr:hypothetical protein CDL12_17353 [Handroanthus impetiginosus]